MLFLAVNLKEIISCAYLQVLLQCDDPLASCDSKREERWSCANLSCAFFHVLLLACSTFCDMGPVRAISCLLVGRAKPQLSQEQGSNPCTFNDILGIFHSQNVYSGSEFSSAVASFSLAVELKEKNKSILFLCSAQINQINFLESDTKWVTDGIALLQVAEITHYSSFNLSVRENKMASCSLCNNNQKQSIWSLI